jgi:hypothetical protein
MWGLSSSLVRLGEARVATSLVVSVVILFFGIEIGGTRTRTASPVPKTGLIRNILEIYKIIRISMGLTTHREIRILRARE